MREFKAARILSFNKIAYAKLNCANSKLIENEYDPNLKEKNLKSKGHICSLFSKKKTDERMITLDEISKAFESVVGAFRMLVYFRKC